jgi:hypothetical protein
VNNVESVAFVSTRQGLPTQSTAPGIALQTRPADHRLSLTGAGEPWRFEIRDSWQNVSDKMPSIGINHGVAAHGSYALDRRNVSIGQLGIG